LFKTISFKKVLIELFQKLAGTWGSAPSRASGREKRLLAVLFGTFSCGYLLKKKYGEDLCNVSRPNFFPFFLWRNRPKKEPKKGRWGKFRACGRDLGRCPKSLQTFEKV
jgi:hypothetical protein